MIAWDGRGNRRLDTGEVACEEKAEGERSRPTHRATGREDAIGIGGRICAEKPRNEMHHTAQRVRRNGAARGWPAGERLRVAPPIRLVRIVRLDPEMLSACVGVGAPTEAVE